ncbi:YfhO family protein [bacterium]|nr:YfhO family protein [bacterium]
MSPLTEHKTIQSRILKYVLKIGWIIPIAVLSGLVFIYFYKAALLGGIFVTGDMTTSDLCSLNFPTRGFLGRCLQYGMWPLWTPDVYCGFPVFAEGEMGGLYPLSLLLFGLFPDWIAYNYLIILNFMLSGIFFFAYARTIGLNKFSSFIGAIAFTFCGFFVTHLKHANLITASCWLPLLFLFVEKLLSDKRLIWAIFGGLVFACQILAGHFQMAYYSMLGAGFYLLFRICSMVYTKYHIRPEAMPKKKKRQPVAQSSRLKTNLVSKDACTTIRDNGILNSLIGFALIGIIGVGLAAVQILPTYEFTGLATRAGGLSFQDAAAWPYPIENLITLIFPYYYGDPAQATYQRDIGGQMTLFWENCGYVGILPLFLGIFGFCVYCTRNTFVRLFGLMAALSLLLTLGKYTPLFELLWNYMPGLKFFRFPNRFLLLFDFSILILSGFGITFLMERIKTFRVKRVIQGGICILVILDLFNFGMGHNPTISPKTWLASPESVKFLKEDKSTYRIYSFGCDESWSMVHAMSKGWKGNLRLYTAHRGVLQPNSNMDYGIQSSDGYPAFAPKRLVTIHGFYRNMDNISLYKHSMDDPLGFAAPKPQFTKLLGIQNVKYITTFWELKSPDLIEVHQTRFKGDMPPLRIYENKVVIPRLLCVPEAEVIPDEAAIINRLTATDFDPYATVILEKTPKFGISTVEKTLHQNKAQIIDYNPLRVTIQAMMNGNGFLVLGDTWYPGWKAFVDGKETEIYRANLIFRAIALTKGEHKVEFVYTPASFNLGCWISGICLALVVLSLTGWTAILGKRLGR